MDSKDSTRPSEDASQTVAGVEDKLNLTQAANATAYESSRRVKPNSGGTC
jgi:hypothetical protein